MALYGEKWLLIVKIKPLHKKTIAVLLQARNIADAAITAGVPLRSLTRWLTDPEFKKELTAAEDALIADATRRMASLADGAIDTLEEIRANPEALASSRLRAAQTELDYLLKMRELRALEIRLAELEIAVFGKKDE